VIATARRAGVGSLLLRAAEDRLRAAHCRTVELETAVDNISALSFYKRHAYNLVDTLPRYYSNGVDALVLKKIWNPFRKHRRENYPKSPSGKFMWGLPPSAVRPSAARPLASRYDQMRFPEFRLSEP
jgi:hypothetical protein